MKTFRNPFVSATLLATTCLAFSVSSAQAQFSRAPNPYSPATNGMSSGARYSYTITPNPWGGLPVLSVTTPNGFAVVPFNPAYPYYFNAGGSHGSAYNKGYTTGSSGSYSDYNQPAATVAPAPAAAYRPDVPRRAFDRWAVQRDQQVKVENVQQKQEQLNQYLSNPSSGDISSGVALNAILDGLQPLEAKFKDSQPVAIDDAFLNRLNFTRGVGSIGLLRGEGKIAWPALLMNLAPSEEVAKLRQQIEEQFMEAFKQVNGGGRADAENLKTTLKSIDTLNDMASGKAQSMTFAENVDVKRFIKSLEDAVAFLKQPDAADWMPGKLKAKPKTVQELVKTLHDKGCRFAPALVGNDAAYVTMHRSLAGLYSLVAPAQFGANR